MDNQIDELRIQISADVEKDNSAKIEKISMALERLRESSDKNWSKLSEVVSQINNFGSIDKEASKGISNLARGLERLQLISFAGFHAKIQAVIRGLEPLKNVSIGFVDVSNFGKGLNYLANAVIKLQGLDITGLSDKINVLVKSIQPLTDEMIRGGNSVNNYGTQMLDLAKATKIANTEIKKTTTRANGLTKSFSQLFGIAKVWRMIVRFGTQSLQQSSAYTENLNLFSVTMGEATDKTLDFALNIAKAYKISSNEIIRYMGLFKQMSSAIGVAESTAIRMSEALTLVAYDISSLYNITIASAMEKLQAGLAGQTKPLRELGLDITAQSMDAYLEVIAKVGYTSKQLTQSDKFILRTILMLEQATASYGNFADTINTFANQQKVLTGQVQELQLALGDLLKNVFTPFLIGINAVVIGIKNLIRAFIPLQKTDKTITNISGSMGMFGEEIEEAEKKLNLLSFDKFEALNRAGDEISKADVTAMLETLFDKTYTDYMAEVSSALENIKLKAEELAPYLTPIAIALLAMIAPSILKGLVGLAAKMLNLGGIMANVATGSRFLFVAFQLLETVAIMALVYAIYQLVTNWNKLNTEMKILYIGLIVVSVAIITYTKLTKLAMLTTTGFKTALIATRVASIALNVALVALGATLIAFAIYKLVQEWDNLSNTMKAVGVGAVALGTIIVGALLGIKLGLIGVKIALISTGIGAILVAIGIAIYLIIDNWDILVKAIKTGVSAVGQFLKALGVSIANFFIGIVNVVLLILQTLVNSIIMALNLTIQLANKIPGINIPLIGQVSWQIPTLKQPKFFADGGIPDDRGGSTFVMNERGRPELIHENSKGQVQISNQESLENGFYRALVRYFSEHGEEKTLTIVMPRGMSSKDLVAFTYADFEREIKNRGGKIIYN